MNNQGTGYLPIRKSDPMRCWLSDDANIPSGGPGWYFWDETWSNLHGPFSCRFECKLAMLEYANSL